MDQDIIMMHTENLHVIEYKMEDGRLDMYSFM